MHRKLFVPAVLVVLVAILFNCNPSALGQSNTRYFPETQHNVSGVFLDYWTNHGGLAQQGYPLTEEFKEISATNNQEYTIQYFERAVFELHPENAAPNNVLLSLLGNFLYKSKYPGGAPGQVVSTDNPRLFTETGHTLGGKFRAYWEANGGLAQQGYPISDEFQEKSELNGQTYTVQYFERAVFELHPENAAPYDVLLSQLGKFQLDTRYPNNSNPAAAPVGSGGIVPNPPTQTPPPAAAPTNTPAPAQPTSAPVAGSCVPAAMAGYSACATVSDATPSRRELVTTTGYVVRDGQPVAGLTMNVVYNYATTKADCTATTDAAGTASCAINIGGASAGRAVRVDVTFLASGQTVATTQTTFTPQ